MASDAGEARTISTDLLRLYRLAVLIAARARRGAGGDEAALSEAVGARIQSTLRSLLTDRTLSTRQLDVLAEEHERFKRLRGLVARLTHAPTPEARTRSADQLADWLREQLPRRLTEPDLRSVPVLGRVAGPPESTGGLLDRKTAARMLRALARARSERDGPMREPTR